jgi:lipopolysaccharide transport system ATP-binding protein
MSDVVVSVENLSKCYSVGHRSAQRERYVTLRDTIGLELRSIGRKTLDFIRGKQIMEGDEVEEFWALRDVTFQVKQGEVLGIVGRNGAGKSTLLKILSRITEPTQGRAILSGRVASLLEVGAGFHPELTGRENIFLNGAVLGMSRAEIRQKFDEIVAFSEIERFLDTPVKRYSSGMYMRLAFAVAAHLEPEILIVDEVLAVGDAEFQKKCIGKLQDVASNQGRTVLFVSHQMAAVESMCDRALLLAEGRCVAYGDTSQVVQEYLRDMSRAVATPLATRTDRSGSGDLRFISMSLEGAPGLPVSAFKSGAEAILHLAVDNNTKLNLRRVNISLGIDNEIGQRVALLDSELIGSNISILQSGRTSVRISIPKLALMPGRYRLTVYSTVNGVIADWVKNAATFDVEAGDYYGTGRLPPHGQGLFLLDHDFIIGDPEEIVETNETPPLVHSVTKC